MKFIRTILELLAILFISIVCISTNPTKAQYTNWLSQYYLQDTPNTSKNAVSVIKDIGTSALINYSTTVKDCIFFSVFSSKVGDTTLKCVGIFDHFIPISAEASTND